MSTRAAAVTMVEFKSCSYPAEHWRRLKRFAVGEEYDPRGLFRLADDKWEAWPYAINGRPSLRYRFRFNFSRLQTFIKLYAKWYCYHRLIGAGGITATLPLIPTFLSRADRYVRERGFNSIDEIAPAVIFRALWDAQLLVRDEDTEPLPKRAVSVQAKTRVFWQRVRAEFGLPYVIPPIAPHVRKRPGDFAADESQVIPDHVIKQLVNRLALHRDKVSPLNRFDHLRLCVVVLQICLGRRIDELLSAPRCAGLYGPLTRRPSASGTAARGALWFQFRPNKNGPGDKVYISPRWEDVARYCVRELIRYGDEIRHLAVTEERDMLILNSTSNQTWGGRSKHRRATDGTLTSKAGTSFSPPAKGAAAFARPLTAYGINKWLNGYEPGTGVLREWGITADGTPDGQIYRLLTKYSKHTRQSALALDEGVSLSARQRDLNHNDCDMQFIYQHRLKENNDALLIKIKEGKLIGHGADWLAELLEINVQPLSVRPQWKPGPPTLLTPRIRTLIRNNPAFMQLNRVPCGLCVLPQGPGGCTEYLNCTSACEGGCHSFVVDVTDPQMLRELDAKARSERQRLNESVSAGRLVQAGKREAAARRTEELRDEAIRRASKEALIRLRELQSEMEEMGQ